MNKTETIIWHCVKHKLPDDEITVMVSMNNKEMQLNAHCFPNADVVTRFEPREPVWLGYHLDGAWYDVQGGLLPTTAVTHWADMPEGVGA